LDAIMDEKNRRDRRSENDRSAVGAAVVITGLTKEFRSSWTLRSHRAVDQLSLTIERGEIFGLLGHNGAGKTTTIKMLLGLLKPTSGAAWLLGTPAGTPESRSGIGYLPEQPSFFDRLTGVEFLTYSGQLAGLDRRDARRRGFSWMDRLGIAAAADVRLRKYSKGMLQRLGLAHALLAEPDLVFLDEPMSGLDPAGRREFRDVILECRKRGVTVVFSSHILPDAEMLCDRIAVMRRGKLARVGSLDELLEDRVSGVDVVAKGEEPLLLPPRFSTVTQRPHGQHLELNLSDSSQLQDLISHLMAGGYELVMVQTRRRSLESVVLECDSAQASAAEAEPLSGATVASTEGRRAG
jgi:ABC-2 type transport system ATP-binding protein